MKLLRALGLIVVCSFVHSAQAAQMFAIDSTNQLLGFDTAAPTNITSSVAVSGLQTGEVVLGIDYRPATRELYALTDTNRLYTIDTATGEAALRFATMSAFLEGAQETTPTGSAATGTATVVYNATNGLFDITILVDGIALTNVTGFHLHVAPVGVDGPIIVNFLALGTNFVQTATGLTYTATGVALPATNEVDLLAGNTYVNVHTVAFPNGEIRGQVLPAVFAGSAFGVDFNPVVDRLRVVSDADENLRINPNTGATIRDTNLAYATGDPNQGMDPNVVGAAYRNNLAGATNTTLFDIDSGLDVLTIQNPPNNGVLTTVGALGVDTSGFVGFDIFTEDTNDTAFASLTSGGVSRLYTVNLSSGAATLVGGIGTNEVIRGIAAVPSAGRAHGVAYFAEGTDTIQISGQTVIGTQSTYEVVILFPNACPRDGVAFMEHAVFAEDKTFRVGPTFLEGFNHPGPTALDVNTNLAFDVFHHIAYVYDGNAHRFYVDGQLVTNAVVGSFDVSDSSALGQIGAYFRSDAGVQDAVHGFIDSVRLSDVARYSGNAFTPPTGDMAADASTVLLYNFNDAPGSTNVVDESALNRTGTLGVGVPGATSPVLLTLVSTNHTLPTILTLEPTDVTNNVGEVHTVTATVLVGTNGVSEVPVEFTVTGVHEGANGVTNTDVNGEATFTYTGTTNGVDTIQVVAFSCNALTATVTKVWVAACPVITVLPASLPAATVGSLYNQTITATGGQPPYSFDVTTGSLPDDLTLSDSGTLSGTPTTNGTFNFTIRATDDNDCTGTRNYTLTINPAGGGEHDLAVIQVHAPKNVNLKGAAPSRTKRVRVQIQNLSNHDETIDSLQTLAELVTLETSPESECATVELIMGSPNKPRTLRPNRKLNVFFDVTFTCAIDNEKGPGHEDFTYIATVHHESLGTGPDSNPDNDSCPNDQGCVSPVTDVFGR